MNENDHFDIEEQNDISIGEALAKLIDILLEIEVEQEGKEEDQ